MHCSIAVVPRKITCGKMKLQLSGTVRRNQLLISELAMYESLCMQYYCLAKTQIFDEMLAIMLTFTK